MTHTRIWMKRALVNLIAFLIIFCVIGFSLLLATKDVPMVLLMLVLVLPYYALFVTRFFVDNIFAFLLLHIIIPISPMLIFDGMLRIFSIIFMSLSSIFSISQRFRGEWEMSESAIYFLLVPVCGLTIIGELNQASELTNVFIAVSFVIIVCYLLYLQIGSIDRSLEFSAKESLQPIKAILRFNNRIIVIFIFLVIGGGMLALVLPFGRLMSFVAGILLSVLRFFLGMLFDNEPTPEIEDIIMEEAAADASPFMPIAEEGPGILYIIGMALYYIASAAVIAGLIALIFYAVFRFYKSFYGTKRAGDDVKEFVTPKIEMDVINRTLDKIKRRLGNNPNEKLRRRYYKKINSHISKGAKIKMSHTTSDIAEILRSQEDIDELTRQYEAARYGAD